MKPIPSLLVVAAALGAAGCGAADSGTTTADQDKVFKSGAKPNITIPPGANKPPANFKSSLNTGDPHMPAGGVPGPGSPGGG